MTSPTSYHSRRNVKPIIQVRDQWFVGTLEGAPMLTSEAAATLADYPVGTTLEVTIMDSRLEQIVEKKS